MSRRKPTKAVEQAFIASYGELEAAIYEQWPDATFDQVAIILADLAAALFQANRPLIRAAINRSLDGAPEDLAVELDDYFQDVFLHLMKNPRKLIGLLFPDRAKCSSVLYGLVRSRIRGVRKQLTDRHALVARRLSDIACETAPPEREDDEEKQAA